MGGPSIQAGGDAGRLDYRDVPTWYGLSRPNQLTAPTDPFDEVAVNVGSGSNAMRLFVSRRGSSVHRWRFAAIGSLDDGDASGVIRRVDGGQGVYADTRWIEHFGLPTQYEHNPNAYACVMLPRSAGIMRSPLAPVVWHEIQNEGDRARIQTVTIPLEWDAFGYQGTSFDHGGDSHHFLLWHRMRNSKTLEVNWRGLQDVHCITDWEYFPHEWDSGDGPIVLYSSGGFAFVDRFADAGFFLDPVTGLATTPATWAAQTNAFWGTNGLGSAVDTNSGEPLAYPFSREYAAAVLANIAGGFGVATYGKHINRDSVGLVTPNIINISQDRIVAAASPFEDNSRGQGMTWITKSRVSRKAGWIGRRYWMLLGATGVVQTNLLRLHASRAADDPVPFDIPRSVLDGMGDSPHKDGPRS